jgi:hypothetical protein
MTATQTRTQGRSTQTPLLWVLLVIDAALLIASGAIHLHLWDIAYRHVKTLDVLFLVQAVGTVLAGLILLVTRHVLVAVGSALLLAGTIVGFVLAKTVGIFGFKLPFITTEAWTVLVIEAVGVVLLAITSRLLLQRSRD